MDDNPYKSPEVSPFDPDVPPFRPRISARKLMSLLILVFGIELVLTSAFYFAVGEDSSYCALMLASGIILVALAVVRLMRGEA